jgi:hypothetical protein
MLKLFLDLVPTYKANFIQVKLLLKMFDKDSLLRLSLNITEIESQSQYPIQTQTIHEKNNS